MKLCTTSTANSSHSPPCPFVRRVEKIAPSATTIYLYDGQNILSTYNAAGALQAKYDNGLTVDTPLAVTSGASLYYQADGLGSVTSLSNASGTLEASYTLFQNLEIVPSRIKELAAAILWRITRLMAPANCRPSRSLHPFLRRPMHRMDSLPSHTGIPAPLMKNALVISPKNHRNDHPFSARPRRVSL